MNEIKRVHLGRQPFIIAVDAYKALKEYLDAIKVAVGSSHKEVIEEVELRMAELLTERGVKGEKAIVRSDIAYLQAQLGNPGDFAENGDEAVAEARAIADQPKAKRLFRDTDRGMLAGVSSGLAAYFGIDPIIVRLIMILGLFTGFWSIPLYILLWVIVPEAKSNSEKLQMQGKAVTVDTLKQVVDQADVQGAAKRASTLAQPFFETLGKIIVVCIGVGFVISGILTFLFGTVMAGYGLLYQHDIFTQGDFGASPRDYLFGAAVVAVIAIIGIFMLLVGVSAIRKKWQFPGWATGVLVSLLLTAGITTAVLAPGVINKVQAYADQQRHTETVQLADYNELQVLDADNNDGMGVSYSYKQSDTYKVVYSYVGDPSLRPIKTTVADGTLTLDTRNFKNDMACRLFCIFAGYEMKVTVYAPQINRITLTGSNVGLSIDETVTQPTLTVSPGPNGWIGFQGTAADKAVVRAMNGVDAAEVTLTNVRPNPGVASGVFTVSDGNVTLPQVNELELTTNRTCSDQVDPSYTDGTDTPFYSDAVVWLSAMPASIMVNDVQVKDEAQLRSLQGQGEPLANRFRCVNVESNRY